MAIHLYRFYWMACILVPFFKQVIGNTLLKKCYKDTRHQIVPVQVYGHPETSSRQEVPPSSVPETNPDVSCRPVRIMIDIRMTNGMHIQQRNLTYQGLRVLVEKLEGLC